jgi:hypothetical protein
MAWFFRGEPAAVLAVQVVIMGIIYGRGWGRESQRMPLVRSALSRQSDGFSLEIINLSSPGGFSVQQAPVFRV